MASTTGTSTRAPTQRTVMCPVSRSPLGESPLRLKPPLEMEETQEHYRVRDRRRRRLYQLPTEVGCILSIGPSRCSGKSFPCHGASKDRSAGKGADRGGDHFGPIHKGRRA